MGLNPVHLHLIPRCGITTVLFNSAEEKQPHQSNIGEPNFWHLYGEKEKIKSSIHLEMQIHYLKAVQVFGLLS